MEPPSPLVVPSDPKFNEESPQYIEYKVRHQRQRQATPPGLTSPKIALITTTPPPSLVPYKSEYEGGLDPKYKAQLPIQPGFLNFPAFGFGEQVLVSYYFLHHAQAVAGLCKQKCSSLTEGHKRGCRCQSLIDKVLGDVKRLIHEHLKVGKVGELFSRLKSNYPHMLQEFWEQHGHQSPLSEFPLSYAGFRVLQASSRQYMDKKNLEFVQLVKVPYESASVAEILDMADRENRSSSQRRRECFEQRLEICRSLTYKTQLVSGIQEPTFVLPENQASCILDWADESFEESEGWQRRNEGESEEVQTGH
jgi:hypothetical protein